MRPAGELYQQALCRHACMRPQAPALVHQGRTLSYAQLLAEAAQMAALLQALGVGRGDRVAIYLDKCVDTVLAILGAALAGAVFVPVNPLLRVRQLVHILDHSGARLLVTSSMRYGTLSMHASIGPQLRTVLLTDEDEVAGLDGIDHLSLAYGLAHAGSAHVRTDGVVDVDLAAILYTSGSTGQPKGVMLSHRNLVSGAASVVDYLGLDASDRILAVLPLSFDYGLNQLAAALHAGASCVLMNYLRPRDILRAVLRDDITCLAAIPPLWQELAALDWPAGTPLRRLTNSGGAMPPATTARLRAALPQAQLFLMYGLTEAFRSTYLPPAELARRPDSIGKAVPMAEIHVLRADGTPCAAQETGELVHRGPLVALGYWNDAAATAQRFRPWPGQSGAAQPELAVWSGDMVRADAEGYLYFVGRDDELIKVSGYRISPAEVEAVLAEHPLIEEVVVFGVPREPAGAAIVAVLKTGAGAAPEADILDSYCRQHLPAYMVPSTFRIRQTALERGVNGKFDRKRLRQDFLRAGT